RRAAGAGQARARPVGRRRSNVRRALRDRVRAVHDRAGGGARRAAAERGRLSDRAFSPADRRGALRRADREDPGRARRPDADRRPARAGIRRRVRGRRAREVRTRVDSPLVLAAALAVFLVVFVKTEIGLYLVIFSMLLSPQFGAGGAIAESRRIVLRSEDILLLVVALSWLAKTAMNKE